MYFPVLRGRQNELIAIRALQERGCLDHVTPIIEPVRASSTLISVLDQFKEAGKAVVVVDRPIVGSFEKELSQSPDYAQKFATVIDESPSLIRMSYCQRGLMSGLAAEPNRRWAYYLGAENRAEYESACHIVEPTYTIVTGNVRNRRVAHGGKIALDSSFVPQKRNIDYCSHVDDFLSEELFYYDEEGLQGFADYSVIGADYTEGGFTPRVVALHLVHLSEDRDQLLVRHFTSSPKDVTSNTGGKFNEALGSLLDWARENKQLLRSTFALDEMKRIYQEGRFPGLGVAKKLAIMHHLELANTLLEEKLQERGR